MKLRRIKLTKYEQEIDDALNRGEYVPVSKERFDEIARMIAARKKNAILHVRISQGDLDTLKAQAKRRGVKYQTFITELLHQFARGDISLARRS